MTQVLTKQPLDAQDLPTDPIGLRVAVVTETYPPEINGVAVTIRNMLTGLLERGHRHVAPLPSPEALPDLIHSLAKPGDMVVCLGAGNITTWAHALPGQLTALATGEPLPRAAGE